MTTPSTKHIYNELNKAFNYFNKKLFGSTLPECVITLARKKGTLGYFCAESWVERTGEQKTNEISLNPELFSERTTEDILSTLVHEMCHLRQFAFGKPSRNNYHNAQWGEMMELVGLIPSKTGLPGGMRTGQQMTHYIEKDGRFQLACNIFIKKGDPIIWQARSSGSKSKKKSDNKTKYTCADCGLNVWAKPNAAIRCGNCDIILQP